MLTVKNNLKVERLLLGFRPLFCNLTQLKVKVGEERTEKVFGISIVLEILSQRYVVHFV
jgi:hypothetical protein